MVKLSLHINLVTRNILSELNEALPKNLQWLCEYGELGKNCIQIKKKKEVLPGGNAKRTTSEGFGEKIAQENENLEMSVFPK